MKTKFQPQGKIIATGEDGVLWELYENGYLLFRPIKKKKYINKSDKQQLLERTIWQKNCRY